MFGFYALSFWSFTSDETVIASFGGAVFVSVPWIIYGVK